MAKRPLDQKRSAKYLGVLIDDGLSWKHHIDNINLKIRRGIGMLYKMRHLVTSSTIKTLYYSFIQPYLDYNLINWSSAPNSYLSCLISSSRKAVQAIGPIGDETIPYKMFDILPFDSYITYKKGIFMWKIYNKVLPESTALGFNKNTADIYGGENSNKYLLPHRRTKISRRQNLYSSIKLWNGIPDVIKASPSLNIFKTKFKHHLMLSL